MEEAAVGCVQNAKAVTARLDFEVWKDFAVEEEGFAGRFGDPGRAGNSGNGVIQLTVFEQGAVADGQRNFVRAARKIEVILCLVAQQKNSESPGIHAQAGDSHRVVVI